MKTLFSIVMVAGIGIGSGVIITTVYTKAPQMTYENNVCDFGVVAPRTKMNHSFRFTNTGNRLLMIKEIRASCGCAVAHVDRNVIPPKESATLHLQFDASKNKGTKTYRVVVTTNEPKNFEHTFFIRATIVPRIELQPDVPDLGQIRTNELPIERQIRIDTHKRETLTASASNSSIYAGIKYIDEERQELYVTIDAGIPVGPLSSSVYITLQGEDPLTLQIPVLGQILGEVYAEPPAVFWGVVQAGDSARKTVRLKANKGGVRIERFSVSDSLQSILTVEMSEENMDPVLIVKLRPQEVEEGRQTAKKIEGSIHVFATIDNKNSHDGHSDRRTVLGSVEGLLEANIPVLFFVKATH